MGHKFITIQYLRGFAAMLVLASHALLYPLTGDNLGFGRLGWLGVILFFVISGFIMVVVTGEGRFSAPAFLRRRFIRVVPMYWGATLLAALLALLVPHLFKTTVYDTGQLLMSLLFVPFYNPVSHGIHPLYKLGWTLNYEVFFYVCFALLAFLGAQSRVIWLTVAFATLAVLHEIFGVKGENAFDVRLASVDKGVGERAGGQTRVVGIRRNKRAPTVDLRPHRQFGILERNGAEGKAREERCLLEPRESEDGSAGTISGIWLPESFPVG